MKIREYLYRKNKAVGLTDKEMEVFRYLFIYTLIREGADEARKFGTPELIHQYLEPKPPFSYTKE